MFKGFHLAGKSLLFLLVFGYGQLVFAVPLSGTVTIGVGRAYTTISDAVAVLNAEGISGPVNFTIASGTYDEQVTIGAFTRTGNADDRVTFHKSLPFETVNWRFSGANSTGNNFVIKLDGASYVTIRGITFTAQGTSPYGKIISLEGGASNNHIENNNFTGFFNTTDDKGSLILQSEVGNHPDTHVTGNSFVYGYKAVDMDYIFGGFDSSGILIDNNTFTSQTKSAIETGSSSAIITNNTISDATVSDTSYIGIDVEDYSAVIENNSIDIRKGWVGIWYFKSGGVASEARIINNMVAMNSDTPLGGLTAINWTCSAASGASCAGAGAGNISDTISLGAGAGVTYTLTATVSASPGENVQLEITVTADGDTPDKASDIDPVRLWFRNGFE